MNENSLSATKGDPYIDRRKWGKKYTLAVFDDRSTATPQIDETVFALMQTHLATPNNQSAVLDACDMCGATGSAADEETFSHRVDG